MATGTPVLARFDSETEMENIIMTEEVGLFSVADDFRGLADNICEIICRCGVKRKIRNECTYIC